MSSWLAKVLIHLQTLRLDERMERQQNAVGYALVTTLMLGSGARVHIVR